MKKYIMNLASICICLAVLGICRLYGDQIRGVELIAGAAITFTIVSMALTIPHNKKQWRTVKKPKDKIQSDIKRITEVVLLSEEDTELMTWELYGRTSALIGRDVKENQVDIDLNSSPYASMVEIEHAVLNFSSGNWYVEDLGSANGISVKKSADGRTYRLSADNPCRLELGDCLYIGLNRLLMT